ncbi:MAG: thioredoxin domain-containing protein [Patescibacteria group bacterium]|nr:thioredoxin domain-containing protein [Patescibacteria group bacterium]
MENTSKSGQSVWESSPKTTFALGLIAGIAVMSTIALVFILNFLMSGKSLGAVTQGTNPPAPTAPTVADPTAPPTADPVYADPRPVDESRDHIWGNADAAVTIVEYSDFECPFCGRHYATMKQIKETYPNDVRIVFRHFPLSFHEEAQKAAEASECAADQGKFWEMYDKIFESNLAGDMSVTKWKSIAAELGMDSTKFDKCLDSGEKASRVAEDLNEGSGAGVEGTPATFVNGQIISGALPFDSFKQIIDSELGN